MARGWESKSVEAQQEEATRPRVWKPAPTPEQLAAQEQRRALELARTRTQTELGRASVPAHRQMLEEALRSLDRQLAELGSAEG